MRKYEIIYTFLIADGNKRKFVQTDDDGNEVYLKEVVQAYNGGEALDKFYAMPQFKKNKTGSNINICQGGTMEVLELCKVIGLKTQSDVLLFKKHIQRENESLIDALKRYIKELEEL